VVVNGECRARDPSKCRTHGNHPSEGQREREAKGYKDEFGTTDVKKLLKHPEENEKRLTSVITHLMWKKEGFEPNAAYREDTGWIGIDYGYPGNPRKGKDGKTYQGGHGISHVLAKHPGAEKFIVDTILHGECYKHHSSERKLYLVQDNILLVVSKRRDGRLLITDFIEDDPKVIQAKLIRGKYHKKGDN
jgi:hypothetical protein